MTKTTRPTFLSRAHRHTTDRARTFFRIASQKLSRTSEAELATTGGTFFALSRDGADLVYIGAGEEGHQLFNRSMDRLDVVPIRDTVQPSRPFFSPDGAWLGFFTDRGLEKISLSGGPATTVCDDPICGGQNRGAAGLLMTASFWAHAGVVYPSSPRPAEIHNR